MRVRTQDQSLPAGILLDCCEALTRMRYEGWGGKEASDSRDSQARLPFPHGKLQQQRGWVEKESPVTSQGRAQIDGGRGDALPTAVLAG